MKQIVIILIIIAILAGIIFFVNNKPKSTVPNSFTVKSSLLAGTADTSDTAYSYENGKYYVSYVTIAGQQKDQISGTEYLIAYNKFVNN